MKNYVITIARGFGSGGKYIGTKLGERLGIPCYEREILAMASEESGLHESIFARTDEKLRGSYLIHAIRSLRVKKISIRRIGNLPRTESVSDTVRDHPDPGGDRILRYHRKVRGLRAGGPGKCAVRLCGRAAEGLRGIHHGENERDGEGGRTA